ncbi:Alpha/Beta hydrolase protein [Fusarium flagelliforme]|nr:Alpha/Beta hydrolase protein [Fusarium flagelliforme]KAH7175083.1 Alpha/Beta hydrolase protein [Fusarium flagelliforme]
MASPVPFKVVYKVAQGSEIDATVFLPPNSHAPCPVLINIHGGAFMLGASEMVNQDQIQDCLDRGWIVVVPNHRLCPQVDLLEGPMQDCRDLLRWIYEHGLERSIHKNTHPHTCDLDHVFAFGTSSGGHLALSLGFGVPRSVAGILDFYGPCLFKDPFWTSSLPHVAAKLPSNLTPEFLNRVFEENPVPIRGGVSLEGQASAAGPNFDDPRQAFALTQIANGNVLDTIFPSREWQKVDPILNIKSKFPPTFIVHGLADTMVPISLSRALIQQLKKHNIQSQLLEIPDEEHTFAARMKVGSSTWNLQKQAFDFLRDLIKD